jgi:hypothetical protein
MSNREAFIKKIREQNFGEVYSDTQPDEVFQNQTLRPILKLQNEILLEIIKDYSNKKQPFFIKLDIAKKIQFIEQSLTNDQKFQNTLKGIVIGLFSMEDLIYYFKNSQSINKRILALTKERILSQIQLL